MEFVIVAPLYIVMLGALFAIGDLCVNRIRLLQGDRFVTWVPAYGRANPYPIDEYGAKVEPVISAALYPRAIGGADKIGFAENANNAYVRFAYLNAGWQHSLQVSVPAWVRGMFAVQNPGEKTIDDKVVFDCNYERGGLLVRRSASERDDVSASYLVSQYHLQAVINDKWPFVYDEENASRGQSSATPGPSERVERHFGDYGE